jgi:hypothetical protein
MEACKNLLRDSMHPQGVGRWVPGGHAATHPLAALRGTRNPHVPLVHSGFCVPCALLSNRSLRFLSGFMNFHLV